MPTDHEDAISEDLRRTLDVIREDIGSVRRHLIFLQDKQDSHEAKTAELIHLYKGASIIGKMTAWVVSIAGGIGILFTVFGDKK